MSPTEHVGESTEHRYTALYLARSGRFRDPTSGLSWEPGDRGPKEIDERLAQYILSHQGGQFEVEQITGSGTTPATQESKPDPDDQTSEESSADADDANEEGE